MLRRMARIIMHLEVDADQMLKNLNALHGVVFSQSVLLAMVENGVERDAAYRIVQSAARTALETSTHLREVLEKNPEVNLSAAQLDNVFDVERVLQYAHRSTEELDRITMEYFEKGKLV
jgi:adenylosuccinate lyase